MRALITLVLMFSYVQAALAQCTQSNGQHPNVTSVQLIFSSDFPSAVIQPGMDMWNRLGCNEGADDFPLLQTGPGAAATVTVEWEPGYNPANNRSCGNINHNTDTITLYGTVRDAQGFQRNCGLTGIAADNLAHEIGHYFGLSGSSCPGYIMFGVQFASNGVYSDRNTHEDECDFVDDANITPVETNNESSSDPWCDAYCWTSCVNNICPGEHPGCPILVDIENDGIHLTGLDDPVWFDIDADDDLDLMSWTDRSEGLLALDRNGNGTIDDGSELFGNATRLVDGTPALNGYLALAELDSSALGGNDDGQIDFADAAFASLWIWTDWNHDGVSQPPELQTLYGAGLLRLSLDYKRSNRSDRYGNEFRFLGRGWISRDNGGLRPVLTWDVFFLVMP